MTLRQAKAYQLRNMLFYSWQAAGYKTQIYKIITSPRNMTQIRNMLMRNLTSMGWTATTLSVALLFINIYGVVRPIDLAEGITKTGGLPGYNFPISPKDRLAAFREMKPIQATFENIKKINNLIFDSIHHFSEYRTYGFYENWFLWTSGKLIYEQLGGVQNSDYIISGRGAWCGQVSEVLMSILKQSGIESRFLGLSGHVVLEVNLNGTWIVVDPDYGVIYSAGLRELEKQEQSHLIVKKLRDRGYPKKTIESYLRIFQSHEDNITLPIDSKLNPRLHIAEVAGAWLKWMIPVGLFPVGLFFLRRKRIK